MVWFNSRGPDTIAGSPVSISICRGVDSKYDGVCTRCFGAVQKVLGLSVVRGEIELPFNCVSDICDSERRFGVVLPVGKRLGLPLWQQRSLQSCMMLGVPAIFVKSELNMW